MVSAQGLNILIFRLQLWWKNLAICVLDLTLSSDPKPGVVMTGAAVILPVNDERTVRAD